MTTTNKIWKLSKQTVTSKAYFIEQHHAHNTVENDSNSKSFLGNENHLTTYTKGEIGQ